MNVLLSLVLACCLQGEEIKEKSTQDQGGGVLETAVKKLTLGGQARVRAEYRDPQGYANAGQLDEDDDTVVSRFRINMTFEITDQIQFFFQPQDSRVFGDEASVASDETNLDLHQGYVLLTNINDLPLSFKMGRQELSYGDQRFVSPLDWSRIGRAWDGFKARYEWKEHNLWVEGFYTILVEGNGAEDDQDFYGIYASHKMSENLDLDAYVFGRQMNNNAFTDELGNVGDVNEMTIGLRGKGKFNALDFSLEFASQSGDYVDTDISAAAFAGTIGYTLDYDWEPRIGLEVTYGSGDDNAADGDRKVFTPLYPFSHYYNGHADLFGFMNGTAIALHLKAKPCEKLSVMLSFHDFTLSETEDAWYSAGGTALRQDATGAAGDEVGSEINLHAKYTVMEKVDLWAGVAHFMPGDFVDTTGDDPSTDWFFLQATINF